MFELIKQVTETWDRIEANLTKAEALSVKQKAINEAHAKVEEKKKEYSGKNKIKSH